MLISILQTQNTGSGPYLLMVKIWSDFSQRENGVTKHLADVGLDVHILKVLVCERMVQAQCGVQTYRYPYAVPDPGELPDLALPARMSIK